MIASGKGVKIISAEKHCADLEGDNNATCREFVEKCNEQEKAGKSSFKIKACDGGEVIYRSYGSCVDGVKSVIDIFGACPEKKSEKEVELVTNIGKYLAEDESEEVDNGEDTKKVKQAPNQNDQTATQAKARAQELCRRYNSAMMDYDEYIEPYKTRGMEPLIKNSAEWKRFCEDRASVDVAWRSCIPYLIRANERDIANIGAKLTSLALTMCVDEYHRDVQFSSCVEEIASGKDLTTARCQ